MDCLVDIKINKEEETVQSNDNNMHLCVELSQTITRKFFLYLSLQLPPVAPFRYCCHFAFIHLVYQRVCVSFHFLFSVTTIALLNNISGCHY